MDTPTEEEQNISNKNNQMKSNQNNLPTEEILSRVLLGHNSLLSAVFQSVQG